jgi:hypothetical protein
MGNFFTSGIGPFHKGVAMDVVDKVEKTVERILSKLVGVELSKEELEQVAGGSKECPGVWTTGDKMGCDE